MLAGCPPRGRWPRAAPGVALQCAEELARGDASAGWCLSIAATSGLPAAYLPAESRAELFGDPLEIPAGVWAPRGKGRPVDGGFLVSGRWPYCSGITHAAVFFAGCIVGRRPHGPPADRNPAGRAGDPRHVAHARPARHGESRCRRRRAVRARCPRVLAVRRTGRRQPAVPVPCVRVLRALDRRGRTGKRTRDDGRVRRARRAQDRAGIDPHARAALGDAGGGRRGRVLAARRAGDVLRVDRGGLGGGSGKAPVPVALRNGLRLAATHAVRTSADVVRSMYDLAGGTAIYDGSPLQRRFRDAHTATAHFQVNAASRELPGRILLGQEADTAVL